MNGPAKVRALWSEHLQPKKSVSVMDIVYTSHILLIHFITTRTFDIESLYHSTYFLNIFYHLKTQKLLSYLLCSIYYIFATLEQRVNTLKLVELSVQTFTQTPECLTQSGIYFRCGDCKLHPPMVSVATVMTDVF